MARYFIISLCLAYIIVCAHSAAVSTEDNLTEEELKYVALDGEVTAQTPNPQQAIVFHEQLTDSKSEVTTQRPRRPTKKPGTYLQSIWDIYS